MPGLTVANTTMIYKAVIIPIQLVSKSSLSIYLISCYPRFEERDIMQRVTLPIDDIMDLIACNIWKINRVRAIQANCTSTPMEATVKGDNKRKKNLNIYNVW